MKTNSEKIRSKKDYRKYFIILPIVFLLCGYILFFVCLTPILDPLISVYSLAFSNTNVNTIDESETNSIFDGNTAVHDGYINYDEFVFPSWGDIFGKVTVEGTEIDCPLIFGDDNSLLRRGAGLSFFSHIPGCGKGILVGGHNNTYFHTLPEAQVGSLVRVETNYGSFTYRIRETKLIDMNSADARGQYAEDLNGDREVLLLYTCYPINTMASTSLRYFVFCEKVSGPQVNLYE
ncbi:MAG: class D sortase [Clostridia bacterium]|nr:class D sortase [Clostridia bacterium]